MSELTGIHEIGEFGLIDRLMKPVTTNREETITGTGDDAAVIQPAAGKVMLVSTDTLSEGIHFDLSYFPFPHLGFKSVTNGVSDLAAMNAEPTHLLVSLSVSSKFSVEAIEEIYSGIRAACDHYGIDFVGGDTSASAARMILTTTVIGQANPNEVVKRSGSAVNELICVTGDLGGAFAGLTILEREKRIFKENPGIQPDLSGNDYILQRQLKPEARTDMRVKFAELGVKPTSMIDVTDGLISELLHLCKASNTGCKIYEEKLPIDDVVYQQLRDFHFEPTTVVLNAGEDYELLFTIPAADYDKIRNHPDISVIGHMTSAEEGKFLQTRGGNEHPLVAMGWQKTPNE